jgi:hypothetical protein
MKVKYLTGARSNMKLFFTLELAIEFYQLSKNLKLSSHLRDRFLVIEDGFTLWLWVSGREVRV